MTTTTDTIQQTRARNLARLMGIAGDERGDETDGAGPNLDRFALVEQNRYSSPPRYYTTHPSPEAAATYNVMQEYASDWTAEAIADLDLGTVTPVHAVTVPSATFDTGAATPLPAPDEDDYGNDADELGRVLDLMAAVLGDYGPDTTTPACAVMLAAIVDMLADTGRQVGRR